MPAKSEPANVLTCEFAGSIPQALQIWDTTLRDGEQTPGVAFSADEKVAIARALDAVGVFGISAGFPVVSSAESHAVARIAKLGLRAQIMGLARPTREDVDAVVATGATWVSFFLPLSDWHMRDKLKATEDELMVRVRDVLPYAKSLGLRMSFAVEDGTRTPLARLRRFVSAAVDLGADYIRIADTVGILTPTETGRLIRALRPLVPVKLGVHFHNDLGLATANTLSALEAGADGADATVAGLGERAGNTPLEELAVALHVKYGRRDFNLGALGPLASLAFEAARQQPPPNKPIVGSAVFSHESGIHVAGILANPITYQPFDPALLGRRHDIIFGKHSGTSGLRHLLITEGLTLAGDQEQALLTRIKDAGQQKHAPSWAEVARWAREVASP